MQLTARRLEFLSAWPHKHQSRVLCPRIIISTRSCKGFKRKIPTSLCTTFKALSQNRDKRLLPSSSLSICPSVSDPTGRSSFRKLVENIQVSSKSDKNNTYFTWITMCIYDNTSLNSSFNYKVYRQSCRENQNTYFIFSSFCPKMAEFMRMWKKNMAEPDRPQMTIKRGACASAAGYLKLQIQTENM